MRRFPIFWILLIAFTLGVSPHGIRAEETPDEANEAAAEKDSGEEAKEVAEKKDVPEKDSAKKDSEKQDTEESDSEKKEDAGASDATEKSEAKEKKEPSAAKGEAKAKTHAVKPKRLKVEVELDGIFVAKEMEEVALRPEVWTDYEIVEIVAHGTQVREGETLIKFDSKTLNEAIADLELEQRLGELAIRRDEEELPRLEKTLEMNLEQAEQAYEHAREDFERYNEIERPMMVKSAHFMVKYYESMYEYEKDELDQLVKMYEADDLTEETEEVVLKRQRNSVEFAEFSLDRMRLDRDETLNIQMPRYDIAIRESLERSEMALARAKLAASIDLNRARYELEQKKQARAKSLDRHAKLLADRDLMEIKAPVGGVVYYGQCVGGQWADMASQIAKLRPKSNASPGGVLMTIVDPRPIYVTANFDEEKRPELEAGQTAKITPPAAASKAIDGKVRKISAIPVTSGKFEIQLEVVEEEIPAWIVAGVSCKAKVTSYDRKDAITIPKAALHTDEDDDEKHYVWLIDGEEDSARPERREVEVGKRSGDDVEITKGLKAEDVVSLEKPKKDEGEEADQKE